MVQYDVEHHLHALGVSGIDKVLEFNVLRCAPLGAAFVAEIYGREIHGVVAVEVGAGAVLHDRSDPDGGEAEGLDVVEFVDQAFEVAAPVGVVVFNLYVLVVPAAYVVGRVTVVETGGHGKVDGLVAEVRALAHKCLGHRRGCHTSHQATNEQLLYLVHCKGSGKDE